MKLILPFIAVAFFSSTPAYAGKLGSLLGNDQAIKAGSTAIQGLTLSEADIKKLSAQSVAEMDKSNPIAPASNVYAKRLAKLANGLQNENGLKLNFKVYLVKEENAFATPDGSVRVFAGLMDLIPNDNELMAVIGHEIGHVKKGHSTEHFKKAYLTRAAREGAAAAGGKIGALAASELGSIGEAAINAKFSRDGEMQADEYGVDFLRRRKIDPVAAVEVMKKLGGGKRTGLLDSHPASEQRAKNLERYIAGKL